MKDFEREKRRKMKKERNVKRVEQGKKKKERMTGS